MVSKVSESAEASSREIENVISEEEDNADKGKEKRERGFQYPVKPYERDCSFFVRTGYCRYGSTCKFNHPPKRMENLRSSPRPCQFYFWPGGCRYGNACKFAHYPEKTDLGQTWPSLINFPARPDLMAYASSPSKQNIIHSRAPAMAKADYTRNQKGKIEELTESPVPFNHSNGHPTETPPVTVSPVGLPLRPDQPVCFYYGRYGLCIFGIGCQYDHPVDIGNRTAAQSPNQVPDLAGFDENGWH